MSIDFALFSKGGRGINRRRKISICRERQGDRLAGDGFS